MLQKIKRKLVSLVKDPNPSIYPDDIFLVSYPKSGNTWMRFVFSHMMKKGQETINFHNVHEIFPEYHISKLNELNSQPRPRLIKSHLLYNKKFPKVVYLIRDPRDVYVSYYFYLKNKLPENTTFKEFLRKKDLYPSRWQTHVESWLDKPNTLILKYEDLLAEPVQKVSEIVDFVGFNFSHEEIAAAVEKSTVKKMQEVEEKFGRRANEEDNCEKFVRKGEKGDWKNHFDDEDLAFLIAEAGLTMKKCDYLF